MLGRVDRYELLELVGQGSFGGVYRARHVHTGQTVALKLARGSVDPDAAARILSEGRAASSLRHANVVGVLDGGTTEKGEAFVVMELLEGQNLSTLLTREGSLPWHRAAHIAIQILDGLAAAHAAGVVHRDVKPSNVFVAAGDRVKVIDFGISKLRAQHGHVPLTLPGTAMGTPGYMAPEQLGDASSVDARADVYSVGATLFEMLSGKRPIEADSFEEWVRKLAVAPPMPLAIAAPHVRPEHAMIVDRALARDRDARWPTAAAMRDALVSGIAANAAAPTIQKALPTFGSTAVPPTLTLPAASAPAPAAPPRNKSALPWVVAIAAMVVTVLAVGLAAMAIATRPSEPVASVPAKPAPTSPPPTATATATGTLVDDDDDPPSTPEAVPPSLTFGSLTVSAPQPVGELTMGVFFQLVTRARVAIEACNPTRAKRTANVDVFVTWGKVGMVVPSYQDEGDVETAKCIARAIKGAASPSFDKKQDGIFKRATFTWR